MQGVKIILLQIYLDRSFHIVHVRLIDGRQSIESTLGECRVYMVEWIRIWYHFTIFTCFLGTEIQSMQRPNEQWQTLGNLLRAG